ncbi:hypothetical protein GGR50DRAFT_632178 [Xylaria sp. CBS 124048]|nr:hypothetical protein GGR50DRAFT_632178 [Xylaria sp. CBS 124048]
MPPQSTRSSNSFSFSDSVSASTRPLSESGLPELDPDLSTTEELTSDDYLSSRTRSVLDPIIDEDDGYGSNSFDTASIYAPSHFPTLSITYNSIDRSWDDEEAADSTRSVTDLDLDYKMENGRRYCGSYYMPNDEDEQVRLQLLNQVYLKVLDGELTTVPLECPTHILDIGTATGEWVIDMAEVYPDCEVTGTDISNIFERRAPQNVYWEVDDAELDWERPSNYYDLVHLRDMTGAFADWEAIYRSALRCLKPGGWLEIIDFNDIKGFHDFFTYFESDSLLYKLVEDLQEASVLSGRPRGVEHLEPRLLVDAGYIDVNLTEYSIPLKTQDGSTGKFWLLSCLNGLEPLCMRLLTKFKGWSPDDVRLCCEKIGAEIMALAQDPRKSKTYVMKLGVLTGRKPDMRWLPAPQSESEGAPDSNEDGFQADSERDPSLTDRKTTTTSPGRPSHHGDRRRPPEMTQISRNVDEPMLATRTGPSSGHKTEDWLRNVDVEHASNGLDGGEYIDATADDTPMEDYEKEDTQATVPTRDPR